MRAQTQLDFAVGMGVFLVVTAFVLSFVPGMLQPFESSNQEETVAANRVADQLVGGMLGSADEPYVLDRECTIVFFEDAVDNFDDTADTTFDDPITDSETYSTDNCNFDDVPVAQRIGLDGDSTLGVRIRLERDLVGADADNPDSGGDDDDVDILCLDANDKRIIESEDPTSGECDIPGTTDDDVLFEIGDSPPDTGSVVVARRTVSVNGGFEDGTSDTTLIVEVW